MSNSISVTYVSHTDGGINDTSNVRPDLTVGELFAMKESGNFEDYTVRLNGSPASFDDELSDGDRVTVSPRNIKGYAS